MSLCSLPVSVVWDARHKRVRSTESCFAAAQEHLTTNVMKINRFKKGCLWKHEHIQLIKLTDSVLLSPFMNRNVTCIVVLQIFCFFLCTFHGQYHRILSSDVQYFDQIIMSKSPIHHENIPI